MNERLREFVRESNLDVYGLGKERYKWEYTVEKFAQLIVQDCADLAYSHSIYSRGVPWNQVILRHWDLPIADSDVAPYLRTPGVIE